jgi:hypothetical protein
LLVLGCGVTNRRMAQGQAQEKNVLHYTVVSSLG